MNHNNIKKEKFELNFLSSNLGSKNNFIQQNFNIQRPDSLEIKVKSSENIGNLNSRTIQMSENVNSSWNSESLDNFILQIKNVNNTPSPITPNSFFNPSDVTQDQEQFADALTIHLNKIKEDYKLGVDKTVSEASYLNNLIQISSQNHENLINTTQTECGGTKIYLLNHQINQNLDYNENQCINYDVIDLPNNLLINNEVNQLNKSQFQSFRPCINESMIICGEDNLQFSSSSHLSSVSVDVETGNIVERTQNNNNNNDANFLKTSDGIIYTRIPDSSHGELLNQLNSLANSNPNICRINPNVVKPVIERDSFSGGSSNDNDSSYGTNDSSIKNSQLKDCSSSNGSRLIVKDEKDLDEMQRRLERKRARNRDAARKCRDRKNSLIVTLEQKYATQTAEKDLIREKLVKSLEEIRRLTEYISKQDPHSKFGNFSSFLNEIKIHELTETDLKDLNLL